MTYYCTYHMINKPVSRVVNCALELWLPWIYSLSQWISNANACKWDRLVVWTEAGRPNANKLRYNCIISWRSDAMHKSGIRNTSRISWDNPHSNSEVRNRVLGPRVQTLKYGVNQNRQRWLDHILRTVQKDWLVDDCSQGQLIIERWVEVASR